MADDRKITRPLIYGLNLARPLASKINFGADALKIGNFEGFNLGSPLGALYFSGLEILGNIPKVKDSAVYRFSKGAGAIGYLASAGLNTYQAVTNKDVNEGAKALLDFGMAYQLIRDSLSEYAPEEKKFFKDLGTIVKSAVGLPKKIVDDFNSD